MTAILLVEVGEDGFIGGMEMSKGLTDGGDTGVVSTSRLLVLVTNLLVHREKVWICI